MNIIKYLFYILNFTYVNNLYEVFLLINNSKLVCSSRFFSLSIFALMFSGLLAFIIVAARIPGLNKIIDDPFFSRKCLISHVILALIIWLHAFTASLFFLLSSNNKKNKDFWPKFFILCSYLGVFLIVIAVFIKDTIPILSNYIPVLNNYMFLTGITLFSLAIIFSYIFSNRFYSYIQDNVISKQASFGIKCTAISFMLSIFCACLSFFFTKNNLHERLYYEFIFWGVGHLLQICSQMGMLSVWIILLSEILGKSPISYKWTILIFIFLLCPCIFGLFLPFFGTSNNWYYMGFTYLMKFCIWPAITIFLFVIIPKLFKNKNIFIKSFYSCGLIFSIFLTLFGYFLGFLICEQNTIIPAHYHAAIGGVTIAFMTGAFWLCDYYAFNIKEGVFNRKFIMIQPLIFGIGQFIFVLGFGYAGINGAIRKAFGSEQHISSFSEMIGLISMGIGGVIAIIGGILFLFLFVKKIHLIKFLLNIRNFG